MKCTEERPSCSRCLSTGRNCDGYAPVPVSRRDLATPINGRSSLLITSQRLLKGGESDNSEVSSIHLDYFKNRVVRQTNYYVRSGFWDSLLFRLYHHEPAVKYAVVALSSLHQHWELNGLNAYEVDHNVLQSYQKAIQHANKLLSRAQSVNTPDHADIVAILVVCVLFICYEHTVGRHENGLVHLKNGMQIMLKHLPRRPEESSWVRALAESQEIIELVDVMNRLEFMAVCFTKAQFSPYMPEVVLRESRKFFPNSFEGYEDARRYLLLFLIWALTLSQTDGPLLKKPQDQTTVRAENFEGLLPEDEQYCFEALDRWLELFRIMQARLHLKGDKSAEDSSHACDFAWMLYLCAKVIIYAEFSGSEMSYDDFTEEFADIVARAKNISPERQDWFSFEDGIVSTLYLVATRCRDPRIRRQAISMLAMGKIKDGVWEASELAKIAEKIVALEEKGIPSVKTAGDIPARARVSLLKSSIYWYKNRIELDCYRSSDDPDVEWTFSREVIFR